MENITLNDKQRPVHIKSVYILLLHSATPPLPPCRKSQGRRTTRKGHNSTPLWVHWRNDCYKQIQKYYSTFSYTRILITLPFTSCSNNRALRPVTLLFNIHVQTDMYPRSFGVAPKRYVKHVTALRIWYGYRNIFLFFKFNNVSCGQAISHLTEAIPLCDIISICIFTSYTSIIKLTIKSATTYWFLATCFGRIAAIFRPTCTDHVPSMCVQYGIPYCTHIEGT